jgi:hypothetical protein
LFYKSNLAFLLRRQKASLVHNWCTIGAQIVHQGVQIMASSRRRKPRRKRVVRRPGGGYKLDIEIWGEGYVVNCPYCGDAGGT